MIELNKLQKQTGIIGNSDAIKQVLEMIAQVGPIDISVLITGESGVGKEIIAKAVHSVSRRAKTELVTVNCGAIPEGIIESELFGHKKGAYTGAETDRKGYFEFAHKGTIFLDEIGETPLDTQVKLLRVIESGEFMRVGDSKTLHADVRIIAATNKDLGELVKKGEFRQDLYYRLKTVTINAPSLRKRLEDLAILVERFSLQFTRNNDIAYRGFMPEAIRLMKQYDWPGNVRELKNFVERIIVLEKGERITQEMIEKHLEPLLPVVEFNQKLPVVLDQSPERAERELILRQLLLLRQDVEDIKKLMNTELQNPQTDIQYFPHFRTQDNLKIVDNSNNLIQSSVIGDFKLEEINREAIERTLKYFNNNRRAAAQALGMSERTLYRKITEYGLEPKIKRK
ncbi:MAG: sigma-54 dependent transcriptional regulator [Candidatus Neomarinimicrobiota bacterium]